MRKSIFAKIGAAAVVLTLVTSSLVGGTFAKYVTKTSATAKVKVADWQVAFKQNDDTVISDSTEITLEGTADTKSLLPGDSGQIDVNIYGEKSEVGYTYTIKMEKVGDDSTGIKFYSDSDHKTEIPVEGLTGTVVYSTTEAEMDKKVPIYWVLPAGADDKADTEMAGKIATYKISMLAEQATATTN